MPANSIKFAKPDHPVLPVIAERWSPYAYDPRPVEREKLLSCLEAARWAASSYNEQPWTFILAERTDAAEFATGAGLPGRGQPGLGEECGRADADGRQRNFHEERQAEPRAEHDMGLAAGNMVLQATALGLQAHQMIGIEPAKVRATYKVPDGHEPLTAIAIGYPAAVQPGTTDPLGQRDLAPRTRKPLAEFVITGSWGQPAKLAVMAGGDCWHWLRPLAGVLAKLPRLAEPPCTRAAHVRFDRRADLQRAGKYPAAVPAAGGGAAEPGSAVGDRVCR